MKTRNSFALIIHPKDVNQLHRFVENHRDDYAQRRMSDHLLKTLFDWCPPIKLADFTIASRSSSGAIAQGYCIGATFLPEMLLSKRDAVLKKIEDALRECEEKGADIATLAAFTSIADGRQGAHVARRVRSMAVTNGSTYTSAMVIEALNLLSRRVGIDLREANMAVIGATGSIGRLCSRYFMGKTGRLTLTGSRMEKLKRLFAAQQGGDDRIHLTTDNRQAVTDADLVISVTSTIDSIFDAEDFKNGAVICDVGFPKNLAAVCGAREDIIVFSGGLAQIPGEIEDLDVMGLPANNICYGCMCEGILLALENRFDLCGLGLAPIPLENVDYLIEKGYEHGFAVPPFFNDLKRYEEEDFDRIKMIRETQMDNCVRLTA